MYIYCIYILIMKKQEKIIILRINEELKVKFNTKAESETMTLSGRIKYLMTLDINNKLKIIDNGNIN